MKYRRISEADVNAIVLELRRWKIEQPNQTITWRELEKRFGFSRQSLQARVEIKAAYKSAKAGIKDGSILLNNMIGNASEEADSVIQQLKAEIEEYKKKDLLWKQRWQRIAYHIRLKGMQVSLIDKPIKDGGTIPTEKTIAKVLKLFDGEIPHSGRM